MPAFDNAHALIVGIADYANIRKLPKVHDAEDLAAAIVDPALCGYDPENVTILLEKDATRDKIRAGFEALKANCNADSTVFLYYSGHGGQVKEGANKGQYLLPVETVYPGDDQLARTAISGTELTEMLRAIKAKRLTVVLDCCHAGGIGEPRDLEPTEPVGIGLSDGYLNELKSGTGRVIISAATGIEPANVPDGAKCGLFAEHLIDGLRGAARGDGGVIRILDLYAYVQEKVTADQPNQKPVLKAELEENYPIARYRGGMVPAPVPIERLDDGFRYDVFLSYRQQDPDKTWVRKTLYPRLKAEGFKVCLDVIDFRLGEPVLTEMERGVVESRYTTAVLTPAYLSSNYTDFENVIAQHLGLEQSQRRFLGILRERCRPRLGIRALCYLDMTDDDEFEMGIARLTAQLREPPERKPAAT